MGFGDMKHRLCTESSLLPRDILRIRSSNQEQFTLPSSVAGCEMIQSQCNDHIPSSHKLYLGHRLKGVMHQSAGSVSSLLGIRSQRRSNLLVDIEFSRDIDEANAISRVSSIVIIAILRIGITMEPGQI
jgi:hypothetical protein